MAGDDPMARILLSLLRVHGGRSWPARGARLALRGLLSARGATPRPRAWRRYLREDLAARTGL